MGAIFIIVLIILAFSLFVYVDNAEWKELSYSVQEQLFSNKKYGAYRIRNAQSTIIVLILLSCLALAGGAIFVKRGLGVGSPPIQDIVKELSDTVQFNLEMQEPLETPPSQFKFEGNNGDSQPVAQEGSDEPADEEQEETTSQTISKQPKEQRTKPKNSNPEQSIYDFEKEQFKLSGGAAERERIQREMDERKRQREQKAKQQAQNGGVGGNAGGKPSSSEGETMVSWDLDGRDAHQKNDWHVRNPGYTCGKGINAKVIIKVKVNSNGEVVTATSMAPPGTNSCCVDQALKYARLSRFEYSSKILQEGTITYHFKSQ
jgi:outer membrane biosynthesis protein TonB